MSKLKVDTEEPLGIKQLAEAMREKGLDSVFGTNERGETVKMELYEENESKVESRPHLRYVAYSDDDRFETEIFFDTTNGSTIHSEIHPIAIN